MNFNQTEATARQPDLISGRQSGGDRNGIFAWFRRHPRVAIIVISALAIMINCYPILFCGRSYVSPVSTVALVHDQPPFLPQMPPLPHTSQHGSDTDAMMWWGVPLGFIESRSLLEHGEIPLWNRYGHAGDILLGQAVTMLGDPLQLIVILGRGSAIAWDIKFLTAKLLFCIGFGWLALRLLGNVPLSLIYAALAAYCGAYFYINNHPVFFVFSYAPWILLSALEMLTQPTSGGFRWGLLWLSANFACFNGGFVEVAVALIGGLNLAALVYSLSSCQKINDHLKLLARMGVATLLFLGLTAPVWITFLTCLPNTYTVHADVKVTQLSPAVLPGLFDDLFYRILPNYDIYTLRAPGSSLLILTGCIFSALRWRRAGIDRFFWVNTGAIIFWSCCVFGGIPASFIAAIPFLNRVGHIHVDFSYLLIIHLTVQSAYGFKSLLKKETLRQMVIEFLILTAGMEVMLTAYCFVNSVNPMHWHYVLTVVTGALGAPMLFNYLSHRYNSVPLLGWIGILLLGFLPSFRFGLYNFGRPELMILPGPRVVLNAPSRTLEKIKSDVDPFRTCGLGFNLAGDYSGVYGIEDIRSCAPLSNEKYIQLIKTFPGTSFSQGWVIEVMDPGKAQPLLNLLNVKYLLVDARKPAPRGGHYHIWNFDDFTIMENETAWPRAFFANQIVPAASNAEFIRQLLAHADQPFIAMDPADLQNQPASLQLTNQISSEIATAEHYQLLANSTAFDIKTTSAGVVCLTEEQARDFQAKANDQPVEVFTVNRAFKGIYLDKPGNYHIEFRYRPHFWNLSCGLFCISSGIVLFLGALELIRAFREQCSVPPEPIGG